MFKHSSYTFYETIVLLNMIKFNDIIGLSLVLFKIDDFAIETHF